MQAAHASMDAIDELQDGGSVRAQFVRLGRTSVGVEERGEVPFNLLRILKTQRKGQRCTAGRVTPGEVV